MLRLYRGPLLDGPPIGSEPFGQWMAIQRSRLEGRLESAVLEATVHGLSADEQERAVQALRRLIELSPMCAPAVLRQMSIEAASGRRQDALLQYERYAKRLKLEFDEEPPAELRQAYEAMKAAPQATRVAPVSLRRPAYVHNDPWLRTRGDAPVLAVLPFRYEGSQASGAALASALSEDITIVLSGCRWFSVLSRATTHSIAAGSRLHCQGFRAADRRRLPDLWGDRANAATACRSASSWPTPRRATSAGSIATRQPATTCSHGLARCAR